MGTIVCKKRQGIPEDPCRCFGMEASPLLARLASNLEEPDRHDFVVDQTGESAHHEADDGVVVETEEADAAPERRACEADQPPLGVDIDEGRLEEQPGLLHGFP